jgi:hypothetical protein
MATGEELKARLDHLKKLSGKDPTQFKPIVDKAQALLDRHTQALAANDFAAAALAAGELLSLEAAAKQLVDTGATKLQKFWSGVGLFVLLVAITLLFVFVWIYVSNLGAERLTSIEGTRPVLTITAIVATVVFGGALLLGSLFSSEGEFNERIRHAREIFLVFSGIFGTVVGFYFGAGDDEGARLGVDGTLQGTTVVAYATGGTPPYSVSLIYGKEGKSRKTFDSDDGWARFALEKDKDVPIGLRVVAADAKALQGSKEVALSDADKEVLTKAGFKIE